MPGRSSRSKICKSGSRAIRGPSPRVGASGDHAVSARSRAPPYLCSATVRGPPPCSRIAFADRPGSWTKVQADGSGGQSSAGAAEKGGAEGAENAEAEPVVGEYAVPSGGRAQRALRVGVATSSG